MGKNYSQNLCIERLSLNNINKLGLNINNKDKDILFKSIINSIAFDIEANLNPLSRNIHPICYVAIESFKAVAYIILTPNNEKGTCWSINFPTFIAEPLNFSNQNISQKLIQKVVNKEGDINRSILISVKTTENQKLSIIRELGFQPLKIMKIWRESKYLLDNCYKIYSDNAQLGISIENLSKRNALETWKLQKAKQSIHLRNILDQHWIDLLQVNKPKNKVITSNNNKSVIAAFLNPIYHNGTKSLEIIRDISWDSRLDFAIPKMIYELYSQETKLTLETSSEDINLSNLLTKVGLIDYEERILLGRTIWRQQKTKEKLINELPTINSLMGDLAGQQPQMPAQYT